MKELFERAGALGEMRCDLAAAVAGLGRFVIVSGGLAVGKTALLNAFGEHAMAQGATVLTAAASRDEQNRPMGVVRQLLDAAGGRRELRRRDGALRLVSDDRGNNDCGNDDWGDEVLRRHGATVVDAVEGLMHLAETRPVVLVVDDVQFADAQSAEALLYVLRRVRSTTMMVVVASWSWTDRATVPMHAEITRLPHRKVRLGPLTESGVARMLEASMGTGSPAAATFHRATGGNPLLLESLIEDSRSQPGRSAEPVADDAYRQAVLAAVHRWGNGFREIAEGIAVTDDGAPPARLAQLLDLESHQVRHVMGVLSEAGILAGRRFRTPAARSAVLGAMSGADRVRLYRASAERRYRAGEPAEAVAADLVASGGSLPEWGSDVLQAASAAALASDDVDAAVRALQAVLDDCPDESARATILASQARAEWRRNPTLAGRSLAPLSEALRRGELDGQAAATVIRHLLWQGDIEAATAALTELDRADALGGANAMSELVFASHWFYGASPTVLAMVAKRCSNREIGGSQLPRTVAILGSILQNGAASADVVTAAGDLLQSCRLDDAALEVVAAALLALARADSSTMAAELCDVLLEEATHRQATTWRAVLGSVRADIALLRGEILAAEEHASAAYRLLQPDSWGVLIGFPLATQIRANTAMGRLDAASELLNRPVPEAMFDTVFGIRYLHARGHYYLATDRAFAALSDFETCGRQMREWNLDVPTLIPWRSDLALAHLRMGRSRVAGELVSKQLGRSDGLGSRVHGVSLRVLAASSEPRRRAALLRESIDQLKAAGDRYELALACADLAVVYHENGDFSRARIVARLAAEEAKGCGVPSPVGNRLEDAVADDADGVDVDTDAVLSDAESRVAALAALGYTNREIGSRIFITVSTVEQHLTRIYRKLRVSNRRELPAKLAEHRIPVLAVGVSRQ